jgi:hypothetical protein
VAGTRSSERLADPLWAWADATAPTDRAPARARATIVTVFLVVSIVWPLRITAPGGGDVWLIGHEIILGGAYETDERLS